MKRFKSIVLTLVAAVVIAVNIPGPTASAQSSALSIAPRKDYVIEQGNSIKDSITIRNLDRTSGLNLNLRVIDFTYTDDGGTPKLMLDQDAEPTTWSLRSYLKTPKSVKVDAGGTARVDFSVDMPKNIGAGSYYSAIIYSTGAPDAAGQGNVGLSASGVTLIFANAPGKVKEELNLKKFGAYNQDISKYQTVMMNEPMNMAYTLENKGNVTEAPVGTITLKDMFGRTRTIENVNPSRSLALIGQTRTFVACIELDKDAKTTESSGSTNVCKSAGLWPGMYTASLDLFYGQNGNNTEEIRNTKIFWYLPIWFVILVGLLLLAAVYLIWRLVVVVKGGSFTPGGQSRRSARRLSRRR